MERKENNDGYFAYMYKNDCVLHITAYETEKKACCTSFTKLSIKQGNNTQKRVTHLSWTVQLTLGYCGSVEIFFNYFFLSSSLLSRLSGIGKEGCNFPCKG